MKLLRLEKGVKRFDVRSRVNGACRVLGIFRRGSSTDSIPSSL